MPWEDDGTQRLPWQGKLLRRKKLGGREGQDEDWSTGLLCGCFEAPCLCFYACWCCPRPPARPPTPMHITFLLGTPLETLSSLTINAGSCPSLVLGENAAMMGKGTSTWSGPDAKWYARQTRLPPRSSWFTNSGGAACLLSATPRPLLRSALPPPTPHVAMARQEHVLGVLYIQRVLASLARVGLRPRADTRGDPGALPHQAGQLPV